jgi:SAM-dependent methyltransferase
VTGKPRGASGKAPLSPHDETHVAWDANAAYWDQRMGEGNAFVEQLIWPVARPLLDLRPGVRVLDVACGNGLYARRLAAAGAEVVACDFSAPMIARAQARGMPPYGSIDYRLLDATDRTALLGLGRGGFDVVICMMALFDMSDIDPLMQAVPELLVPGGRFVFSIMHPAFNSMFTVPMAEEEDREGELVTTFAVKVRGYLTSKVARGLALRDQPVPQVYFHRPLHTVLGAGFSAGMMLDALEEPAFSAGSPQGPYPLGWGSNFHDIPPVLVGRFRTGPGGEPVGRHD